MIELNIKLGAAMSIKITGDTEREVIEQGAFWAEMPTICSECGAPVRLYHRSPKNNHYYGLRCEGVAPGAIQHEYLLGIYKQGGTLFHYNGRRFSDCRAGVDPDPEDVVEHQPQAQQQRQTSQQAPPTSRQQAPPSTARPGQSGVGKGATPATTQQLDALEKIASRGIVDVEGECYARYGVGIADLTQAQASEVLADVGRTKRTA